MIWGLKWLNYKEWTNPLSSSHKDDRFIVWWVNLTWCWTVHIEDISNYTKSSSSLGKLSMLSFCLINFGHIISEFYWKFGELDKSCAQKDSLDFISNMLGNILGNFGNFSLTGKAIKVDFLFLPRKRALWKHPGAKNIFGILKILFCSIIMGTL